MYSEGIVIGTVVAVELSEDGKKPSVVLVEDRSRPDWVQKVACEFFAKQQHLIQNIRSGDLVRVVGGIKSTESRSGGYFTHFVGFALQPLSAYMTEREGQIRKQHTERAGDRLPF